MSEMFFKLWDAGLIQIGIWETFYLVLMPQYSAFRVQL